MALIIRKGDMGFGYQIIPERKKPVLGIFQGNTFTVFGQFRDEKSAQVFMEELADFIGAERVSEDGK